MIVTVYSAQKLTPQDIQKIRYTIYAPLVATNDPKATHLIIKDRANTYAIAASE